MESSKEAFVFNLKRLRRAKYKSQEAFAPLVGLSERGYQKYEQGESEPTPEILDRFADKLGCTAIDLITPQKKPAKNAALPVPDVAAALEMLSKFSGLSPVFQRMALSLIYENPQYTRGIQVPPEAQALLQKLFGPLLKAKP